VLLLLLLLLPLALGLLLSSRSVHSCVCMCVCVCVCVRARACQSFAIIMAQATQLTDTEMSIGGSLNLTAVGQHLRHENLPTQHTSIFMALTL